VVEESLLLAPKFFNACGMVDHLCLIFFSDLLFSSLASKTSNMVCIGVADVAENTGGGENASFEDVTGVGGPTSSSPYC
jgi:hypothetical protein